MKCGEEVVTGGKSFMLHEFGIQRNGTNLAIFQK